MIDAMPQLFFFGLACVLMLLIGNSMIAGLRNKQWKKGATTDETWAVREDTPDTHQAKKGTPSMGGIGIVAVTLCAVVVLTFVLAARSYKSYVPSFPSAPTIAEFVFCFFAPFVLAFVLLFHGLLGFADDYSKASGQGGLRARTKLVAQILLAIGFVGYIVLMSAQVNSPAHTPLYISPVFANITLLQFAFLAFVVVAVGNAVNLTDGIDGLAAGLTVQSGLILCFTGANLLAVENFSRFTLAALAGACFGFLFFNRYKARVFMGDTGSLAIGAALGAGAILQGAVFLLPFIGFIYFVEMFSVIAQVLWFKWTKRKTGEGQRLFRRAPLHHHFELGGWSEWRVVGTFWAVNLFASAIGLWLWHAGVLPRWP